ncbi:MAG: LysR family transcriptional regulator [Xanthomonadales bacterium]|nr:LysR family transcriptional regulator [Gammaproteobacteria bacterium]NNK38109.1 LysR family transcriptional regulator [Xanthomonadales bacterium]
MKASKRMPSLRALRAFQVTGNHLSFKLAADELFLTASAVSHQVKNLEAFLGIDLFRRKTRGLEFTDAGRKYHAFLASMFARLEAETHQLWAEYGRRIIRLCVPPFFASELLLPRLSELKDVLPDTDVRVVTQPSTMGAHPADADLSILLGSGDWPGLVAKPLFSRRIMTACAPGLKKKVKLKTPADLDGRTLIVHENRPQSWVNWARSLDLPPPRAGKIYRFDSMAAVVQAAAQGHGIALVSWPLSRNWFESGALVRALGDEVETDESFCVAYRPEDGDREEVARLIEWIVSEFRPDS